MGFRTASARKRSFLSTAGEMCAMEVGKSTMCMRIPRAVPSVQYKTETRRLSMRRRASIDRSEARRNGRGSPACWVSPRRGNHMPAQGNALWSKKQEHPCPEEAEHGVNFMRWITFLDRDRGVEPALVAPFQGSGIIVFLIPEGVALG
jgi:hypothetical protein